MEFYDLYSEGSKSKYPRAIRTSDDKVYKYNVISKRTEEIDENLIEKKDYIIEFNIRGENQLYNLYDVLKYVAIVKDCLCGGDLKIKYNCDFLNPKRLINYLTKKSLQGEIKVDNCELLYVIDKASAGGSIIAEKGNHEGEYKLYDITNSYNKFFINWNIPNNPQFKTVDKIDDQEKWMLYRLKICRKFTQEENWKFKLTRKWFTKFDIDIFDMFKINYELIQEANNCVEFVDIIETDFSWMETVNETKQKINSKREPLKKNVYKNLLSSFWGNICKYECVTQEDYGEEISEEYFHKTGEISGQDLFINPDKFYLYGIAICKPFVLAYARYRLLKQVHKVEKKGFKVVYTHTDSILTNAAEKYIDIGSEIGKWKLEHETKKGVIVNNVASKTFL